MGESIFNSDLNTEVSLLAKIRVQPSQHGRIQSHGQRVVWDSAGILREDVCLHGAGRWP